MIGTQATWAVSAPYPLLFVKWDDTPSSSGNGSNEVIAYHTATGDVHLITRDGANILKLIEEEKLTQEEITRRFMEIKRPELQVNSSDDILEAFLIPFHRLGLIELFEE